VVCQDVELKGDITIGSGSSFSLWNTLLMLPTGTIVHPKATVFAIAGPIVIGANCIIEEAAIIVNR
jgi:dynactin-6